MRHLTAVALGAITMCSVLSAATLEQGRCGILLRVHAYLRGGRALVPLRALAEWSDATVDCRDGGIHISQGEREVRLRFGSREAWVGDRQVTLDEPPLVLAGTTLVPLRFVGEGLGLQVDYVPPSMDATRPAIGLVQASRSGSSPVLMVLHACPPYIVDQLLDGPLHNQGVGQRMYFQVTRWTDRRVVFYEIPACFDSDEWGPADTVTFRRTPEGWVFEHSMLLDDVLAN